MATSSFTVAPISDTDANWRLWTKAIHDAIVACGLVDQSASGEIDFVTTVKPTAVSAFRSGDFKVYALDDALQASYPGFLKIEFGSSNSSAQNTAVRATVGTAHDGSGGLTGTQVSSAIECGATNSSSSSLLQCWASGDTNRFVLAFCAANGGNNYSTLWGLERTVDASGDPNGDGIFLYAAGGAAAGIAVRCQVVPPSGGVPPLISGWPVAGLPITAGGHANGTDTEYPVAFLIPHRGRLLRPVLGLAAVNPNNMPTYGGTLSIDVYGAAHTYLSVGSMGFPNGAVCNSTSAQIGARWLMRYE